MVTAKQGYLGGERRGSDRFPIEREVRYKVVQGKPSAQCGKGQSVNMSSGGILFTAEQGLSHGSWVEVSVNWPAQLNPSCRLKLVALGRIVRADAERAAIEIEKYEFKTWGSRGF